MHAEFKELLNRQKSSLKENMNTCVIAEINSVDLKHMRADVIFPDEEKTLILRVPIAPQQTGGFIIRPPYKKGDSVVIVFSQQDIDPFLYGGGDSSDREHHMDDAIIIGGARGFTEPLPDEFTEHAEDLIIAKRDFSARIILKVNGEMLIESDEDININSQKDINISAPNGIVTTSDSRGGA